ncbi:IS3 family transposase [Ureibacillus thermosphaericus]|uniref:IS3 family transposase n=1 Tax=Ureibacillus thermosphaericus TaxID=51173 RepID=UPI000BBCEDCB|nr:IS3 family transposase [Ureibacillus thermosphaericus]
MNDKEQQFAFIHAYAEQYPISILAEIANVSRAGYYKWLKRNGEKHRDQIDERLIPYILKVFNDHRGTVGRKRIKIELERQYGLVINEKRIARLMRKYGLVCKIRQKKFRYRPSVHGKIPNLLSRNFKAIREGVKFSIDITYIRVKRGRQKWVYLCAIKDLFNEEIVAYSMGTSLEMKLVYRALEKLKKRGYSKGAILHSDQGTHFTNPDYQEYLREMEITQSMSRRGNCWDNACIENFFSHLKVELGCFSQPETVREIYEAVENYINYYNTKRIVTKLKMSPMEYRTKAA